MAVTHRVKAARADAGACELCLRVILKGFSYKWVQVKAPGSKPGERRIRCQDCEDWHEWDYNPSIASQCARVAHDTEHQLRNTRSYDTESGARAIMHDASEEIRIFANTRQVSAERAQRAFGPANLGTKKFMRDAQALRDWSKDIANWRCPALPDPELTDCSLCSAKRMNLDMGGDSNCIECQGEGRYYPDTPGEEQLEDWRNEVADSAIMILERCPI